MTQISPLIETADPPKSYYFYGLLLLITFWAALLRLYQLDEPSFWLDELFTIRSSNITEHSWLVTKVFGYIPFTIMFSFVGIDTTMLTMENVANWQTEGVTEWRARLPAAMFAILTIPLLGVALRRMVCDPIALLSVLFLSCSTWHLQYSQVARFYSQQFLFYNLALVLYFTSTQRRSQPCILLSLLLLGAAFLSQPTALVLVVVLAGDWIISFLRREPVVLGKWTWLLAISAIAGGGGMFLYEFFSRPTVAETFIGQPNHSPASLIAGTIYMIGAPVAIAAALSSIWLLRTQPRLGIYLLLGMMGPVLAFAGIGLVSRIGMRYVFVVILAWMMVAAIGAYQSYLAMKPSCGRTMAAMPTLTLIGFMLFSNVLYFKYGAGFRPLWRDAFAMIEANQQPGETVFARHPWIARYYLGDPDIGFLPHDKVDLQSLSPGDWVVIESRPQGGGSRDQWLNAELQLYAVFNTRVPEPYTEIRVLRVPRSD